MLLIKEAETKLNHIKGLVFNFRLWVPYPEHKELG